MEIPDQRLEDPIVAKQIQDSYNRHMWEHDPDAARRGRLPNPSEVKISTVVPSQTAIDAVIRLADPIPVSLPMQPSDSVHNFKIAA